MADLFEILDINISQKILSKNKAEGRCSGHCCVGFTFPISIQDIKDLLQWRQDNTKIDESEIPYHDRFSRYCGYSNEYFEQLLDMFIDQDPTINDGFDPAVAAHESLKDELLTHPQFRGFFTCKHFNKETGDCMNYVNRPDFCRSYPSQKVCYFTGCTASCSFEAIKSDSLIPCLSKV